eukprot:1160531-Pelagomonas_calceolata.AAC.13
MHRVSRVLKHLTSILRAPALGYTTACLCKGGMCTRQVSSTKSSRLNLLPTHVGFLVGLPGSISADWCVFLMHAIDRGGRLA